MNADDLIALHGNPDNWHLVFFYFAPDDPRIVVKKRLGIGWTINFARPMAIPFLAALIASVYAYINILSQIELAESGKWMGVFLLIILIVALCGWMSNPHRFISKSKSGPRD